MSETLSPSPRCFRKGKLPDVEIQKQLTIASDPVVRNAGDPDIQPILSNQEYRQLRNDLDRRNKEAYEKIPDQDFAQGGAASDEPFASTFDEEAELYLETFPDLMKQLFKALNAKKESSSVQTFDAGNIGRTFNEMAHLFQTDNISLDQRISVLTQEFQELHEHLQSMTEAFKESILSLQALFDTFFDTSDQAFDDYFFEKITLLNNLAEDFELYWSSMSFTARKLGRLQTQDKVQKILNVMIYYVRTLQTRRDIQRRKCKKLQQQTDQIKKVLEDNNVVSFRRPRSDTANVSIQESDSGVVTENEPFAGPLPESLTTEPSCFAIMRDFLRRELFWPWNRDVSIKGIRQGITIVLIIVGIWVYLYMFFPSLYENVAKRLHKCIWCVVPK